MNANASISDAAGGQAAVDLGVRAWLVFVAALIAAMVIVGGATRLTDSGLSITEWQVFMGAIPPLSQADWQAAFDLYKQIPEYRILNRDMTLEGFKAIYWWEWAHRFLGRFVGVAFLVPFVFFWLRGRLDRPLRWRLGLVFALGGAQGALGWYMVASGLVERTDVSQYRLAAHLALAMALFGYIVWLLLRFGAPGPSLDRGRVARAPLAAAILVALVFVQIVMGGFVAGLDAGFGYNTWPLMDGAIIPTGLGVMEPAWRNLFENALTVQFVHRMIAYVIVAFALVQAWLIARAGAGSELKRSSLIVFVAVLAQAGLGIATLLSGMHTGLALLHQGAALAVLALALWHMHAAFPARA